MENGFDPQALQNLTDFSRGRMIRLHNFPVKVSLTSINLPGRELIVDVTLELKSPLDSHGMDMLKNEILMQRVLFGRFGAVADPDEIVPNFSKASDKKKPRVSFTLVVFLDPNVKDLLVAVIDAYNERD